MHSNDHQLFKWSLSNNTLTIDKDIKGLDNIRNSSNEDYEFLLKWVIDNNYDISLFKQTPRIVSYLLVLCAGSYHCFPNLYYFHIPISLFVRDSLKYSGESKEEFNNNERNGMVL